MNISSNSGLSLPERQLKPRKKGLTILIDNGISLQVFKDTISSSSELVDFVKFGWGTSLITKQLQQKIDCLLDHDVQFFFGGTLFEKFLSQNKLEQFYRYCKLYNCQYIEISNGTIDISNREKASYISDFSSDFQVFSEVGSKNSQKSDNFCTTEWIEYLLEDLEAGSSKVITEARESGTSGICQSNGDLRLDIINDILSSCIKKEDVIFEAPTKKMQTFFIQQLGSNVNLANIPFSDVISLETLRLGLRSDTFYLFDEVEVIK
ncbi:phosphosulfolactate synthase [Alkalihalobacillus sp. MEB130]|uniref:phosphosulfolactate synthase n=1 Tax=Alkalihalobacillus sp. MEB130 TaxID=2976704 RepID=UPI0028DE5995|nr:phosphosulfolactate synthase [Alkalihalobacillus sp. MEB130]MDT8859890.1 phosphosulfolactate synthase [Alkalihalobacillus sp. MEB130]